MGSSVFLLGTRGSVPVCRQDSLKYGGATLCIFMRLAGQPVVLDAGTGLLDLPPILKQDETDLPLLLSHPHADHLLGLPMCPILFDPQYKLRIYGADRNGLSVEKQIQSLMSPPLWPVSPQQLGATVTFHPTEPSFDLGAIHVDTLEGIHPGGVTLFRLTGDGKTVVYMTDCTLTESFFPKAVEFARDCDLLLCDGQYSKTEWTERSHFGHSTWTAAAQLAAAAHAKQARIIHHDPFRTDAELDAAAKGLTNIHPGCAFARAGEEITL
jgi:phosphoribosyl 1,2-cyclic phosphodiesterase